MGADAAIMLKQLQDIKETIPPQRVTLDVWMTTGSANQHYVEFDWSNSDVAFELVHTDVTVGV